MSNNIPDYTYSFESSKSPEKIFETLLDVRSWWSGLHEEKIEGSSNKLNNEFAFNAGGGAHYSRQKLIELIPGKKITWLVTDSNLNFLKKPNEWTNTKICFDIFSEQTGKTKVTFTHEGLVPKIECYKGCVGAWTKYLNNLSNELK